MLSIQTFLAPFTLAAVTAYRVLPLKMLRFALDQQKEDYELETLRDGEVLRFVH
jgi:hypothetical protein